MMEATLRAKFHEPGEKLILYVDNMSIIVSITRIHELEEMSSVVLDELNNWLVKNTLKIHVKKT